MQKQGNLWRVWLGLMLMPGWATSHVRDVVF